MATSIKEAVNINNVIDKPNYQVTANPVDTFVSGTGNEAQSRGQQVANALEAVSGSLQGVVTATKAANIARQKAAAAEYQKEVVRDKARADGIAANWTEQLKNDLANTDLTKTTQEEWYQDWKERNPTFVENFNTLTTEEGRLKFGVDLGDVLGINFDIERIKQQNVVDDQLITNSALALSSQILNDSADSKSFKDFITKIEQDMFDLGNKTNQSRMPKLRAIARQMYEKNNDDRLYQWLLGEVAGRTAIGDGDFQNDVASDRRIISDRKLAEENERRKQEEYQLKQNKIKLSQEGVALFTREQPPTIQEKLELIKTYTALGVDNAASFVTTMETNFNSITKLTLSAEEESDIWLGYFASPTPDAKLTYIQEQVNSGKISKGLMSQLYSRLGNDNDKTLLSSTEYTVYTQAVNRLTQVENQLTGFLQEDSQFSYLKPLFQQRFLQMATSPDWETTDKMAAVDKLYNDLRRIKEINEFDKQVTLEEANLSLDAKPMEDAKAQALIDELKEDYKGDEYTEKLNETKEKLRVKGFFIPDNIK